MNKKCVIDPSFLINDHHFRDRLAIISLHSFRLVTHSDTNELFITL